MCESENNRFDIIVLGGGHAGCESALACGRMGLKTLIMTMNINSVALMACNPAIGGTSKGHLVREIDALGGEMGLATDECLIQSRMLNLGKGPAVHSLRAQMDKTLYHARMKRALESAPLVTLLEDECVKITEKNGRIHSITAAMGGTYFCRALIVATGVYLKSKIFVGSFVRESGPSGLLRANHLSDSLIDLGFDLRRFKTGTPARVNGRTLDYSKMEPQFGDEPIVPFSFMTAQINRPQAPCYLTYTNAKTHEIILSNINKSAMYSGLIHATGARYCPSIEDKLVRFKDKERHQIFIEPEGLDTLEMYVQGMSTSLPADVQQDMLKTLPGLENCQIMRPGYAIEYDCIDPTMLNKAFGARSIQGLYFAGQINGSSGYEEAAAQGLMAGINAALYCKQEAPLILNRQDAYIGVLADDLTIKGTNEPYRMMTSRAEYRLLLRQDNADLRLTGLGRRTGLISDARYDKLMYKLEEIQTATKALNAVIPPNGELTSFFASRGEDAPKSGVRALELLKRQNVGYTDCLRLCQGLPVVSQKAMEQVELNVHYEGYIKKQLEQVARQETLEGLRLPADMDYNSISGLRIEARQKLAALCPPNIGVASRIPGVSPADISVLLIKLKARELGNERT